MLVSKEEVVAKVVAVNKRYIGDVKLLKVRMNELTDRYNFPVGVASDMLTMRIDMDTLTDFQLFCLLDVTENKTVAKYFTESEINTYRNAKYVIESIRFPLKFNMVKIAEDQFIGRITVSELIKLRDAQLINYNENAQRTMRHVVDGNTEYYKIYLNQKAVDGIQNSFQTDMYIPNTITLNIPEDTIYDYKDGELSVSSINHFDILDGYHRYIAISKIVNKNPSFDYAMELRIVQFDEGKAKQFIWQEDQKTKMRKADSDSFNQNDTANKIVNQLNTEVGFVLAGCISRNGGIINAVEFSKIIRLLFIDARANRETALKQSIAVRKLFKEKLSYIINDKEELLEKKWDCKFLACACVCVYADVPNEKLVETIERIYGEYTDTITILFSTREFLQDF